MSSLQQMIFIPALQGGKVSLLYLVAAAYMRVTGLFSDANFHIYESLSDVVCVNCTESNTSFGCNIQGCISHGHNPESCLTQVLYRYGAEDVKAPLTDYIDQFRFFVDESGADAKYVEIFNGYLGLPPLKAIDEIILDFEELVGNYVSD